MEEGIAQYANQEAGKALASIASLLKETDNLLPVIRRELRGEAMITYDNGEVELVQVTKPSFIRFDNHRKALTKTVTTKRGEEKEVYLVNDEAVEEVLSMLKMMGLNKITLLTNLKEKIILDDLKEFEMKLAALLALKQREWGIDKEMLPILHQKIKTLVQDARYMCREGTTLRAIQKTVQRIESFSESPSKKGGLGSPYNFVKS